MTTDELARGHFVRARKRMHAPRTPLVVAAYPDMVREAHELVELVLKGMPRCVGIDPPKWHDVGSILLEEQERFSPEIRERIPELAAILLRLRQELKNICEGRLAPTRHPLGHGHPGGNSCIRKTWPTPINTGVDLDKTIRELAEAVRRVVGYEADIVFDSTKQDGTLRKVLPMARFERFNLRGETTLMEGLTAGYADCIHR
jgi:HEPN domain-containing protein